MLMHLFSEFLQLLSQSWSLQFIDLFVFIFCQQKLVFLINGKVVIDCTVSSKDITKDFSLQFTSKYFLMGFVTGLLKIASMRSLTSIL